MKITRISGFAAFIAAAAVVLAGCGSDPAASDPTSSAATQSATSEAAASSDASSAAGSAEVATSGAATSGASSAAGSSDAGTAGTAGGAAAGVSFDAAGFTCATGELRSSGSTAQGKAIDAWIKAYNAKCGAKVNDYGGGGSGKGITDFTANQTDFAGSDSALKDDQTGPAKDRCQGADAIDLPMVTGPIAIAFKLQGVDSLTLTPAILAGIFDDKITSWDDAAIKAANPDVTLPATAIQSVHRSEDSGTTENFVKYLKANSDWAYEGGKAWEANGGTGANGSDGVAKAIAGTDGAIGYIEWGYATADNLTVAKIDNGGGAVELTAESAGKAVSAAKVVGTGKDLSLELDYATKQAGAYPIILVTYEIACSANNGDKLDTLKSFLGYAATDGQAMLTDVGAAPLPAEIQTKVIAAVSGLS
ncbi:phosphate ABC transporter substrate-binding protein PstS [Nakamurella lactea]|uniref:phosphate ABC transporter substrate-binding protein PstS n=1 Tax=Nakamurella lactea TaxID=459515 RepID=UPI0004150145|nr:phosphate ABC transporter substrate-binding protein PstS [Nakamurella lactea]